MAKKSTIDNDLGSVPLDRWDNAGSTKIAPNFCIDAGLQ
jgi:hypothetical protein